MIEVRLALPINSPEIVADPEIVVVRHFVSPCRCGTTLAGGETCARCGRYPLTTILAAAEDSWYPPEVDAKLRAFRGVDEGL